MNKYFNIYLELNKNTVDKTITTAISEKQKGYVCVIESNNLTIANKNKYFKDIVNNALINICDGSNIAWLLGRLHKQSFQSYTGNDIFINFITKKKYNHFFIGNTQNVLDSLKTNLSKLDPKIKNMEFRELPFKKVNDFNYLEIANEINQYEPDLIWISLGAPKQEIFMSLLMPYLNKGILLGVGAVFNFNSNTSRVKRAPLWMRNLRLEWLYRAMEEPKKNIPRYWNFIKISSKLILEEKRHIKSSCK